MGANLLQILLRCAVSLLPVGFFLAGLMFLDSYKLIHLRTVTTTILVGCAAAALAMVGNSWCAETLQVNWIILTRYISPPLEETLKAAFLIFLLRTNKVGFMVDAAIRGFAIGAGFALLENLYYLFQRPDADVYLWVIRGFGTAVMHGGTTAIFGIASKHLLDRFPERGLLPFIPGLAGAVVIHSVFNHFFLTPLISTVIVLLALPTLITVVFRESEKATRNWLGVGFDSDRSLLEMITGGTLLENRIGQYLQTLQDRFPGETVADMLCYLRVHLELSIRAKGLLLMREAGFDVPPDPEVKAQFDELGYLEKSIGKTGHLALHPFLHTRTRDLWQMNMLSAG